MPLGFKSPTLSITSSACYHLRHSASLKLKWCTQSYLADRHQEVKNNKTSSEFPTIKSGVPQGSILGPLLFIILSVIYPGLHLIHCRSDLYADDTTISTIGKNLGDIEKLLNIDAGNIYQWCTEDGLTINVWLKPRTFYTLAKEKKRKQNRTGSNISHPLFYLK